MIATTSPLHRTVILGALILIAFDATLAAAQVPIVYVRCARTDQSVEFTGDVVVGGETRRVSRVLTGFDAYDNLPDVTRFFGGFAAPCDLMYRAADGAERVLYDCSSTSTEEDTCAAMDPAVSFDGRTIAFSVFQGTLTTFRERINGRVFDPAADNARAENVVPEWFPNRRLSTTYAHLHLVDVATGEVTELPGTEEDIDSGPAFMPNGRLAFTSTRDGHTSTLIWRTNGTSRGSRIWTMDIDGRNLDLASHHSLSLEEHPLMLRDGRLAYSSWQVFGGIPFRYTNGSPGGSDTSSNIFHIFTQEPDGAHNFAFFGQHSGNHAPSHFGASHNAAHFLAQTSDERVWFADYYRGNNHGLGIVVGVMSEPPGQEGIGPEEAERYPDLFAPRDGLNFAPWATNGDQVSGAMEAPGVTHPNYADPLPFVGKVGHPGALPDNGLMVSWGKGPCSTVTGNRIFETLGREVPPHTSGSGQGTAINLVSSLNMDTPACDVGIYRATVIPSVHPSDLELIVDTREWHEIMARAVVPYSAIFPAPQPDLIPRADTQVSRGELETGTPFALLGAASIIDRETHPYGGIHFAGEHQFHGQGTDTINYEDEDLCGVRILGVLPNRSSRNHLDLRNIAGERIAILGELSVRNTDAEGNRVMDPSGVPDTSFLVRMPSNMPYLMQAIDCDGRTLNTDQSWQALRPGEMKTCGGCHVHSRPSRIGFDESFAADDAYAVVRFGEGEVTLLAGESDGAVETRRVDGYGLRIDFSRDIAPIFEARCNSCHGGDSPAAGLALDREGVDRPGEGETPGTWWCLIGDSSQSCVPPERQFDTGAGSTSRAFRRPQLTRYVRAFNSLGSLLYWKAGNARTDHNTDETFNEASPRVDIDIDFGADHPTDITPDELGLLSRWIDIGAPAGPAGLLDTQKPTLHLAAIIDGMTVTELRIGTVDLGGGIDVASLEVCVLGADGACENIAGPAEPHGILSVALASPLSDVDLEVRARVHDIEGNETVVVRTVGWLLNTPPPPPPIPPGADGGVGDAWPDGSTPGDEPGSGCGCVVGGRTPSPHWAWLMLLLVWRRRRRVTTSVESTNGLGEA